jgi:hypothetical protein
MTTLWDSEIAAGNLDQDLRNVQCYISCKVGQVEEWSKVCRAVAAIIKAEREAGRNCSVWHCTAIYFNDLTRCCCAKCHKEAFRI